MTTQRKGHFTLYMRTMGVHSYVWLVPVLGLASCIFGEPDPNLSDVDQAIRCDPEFCSTNSPLIGVYGTWEFALDGTPNDQGFALLGLGIDRGKATEFFRLHVENSRIYGLDGNGNVALRDYDLIGAKIFLDHYGKQHAILISNVGAINEVVKPGDLLQSYVLDWSDVIKGRLPGPMPAGAWLENQRMPLLSSPAAVCPEPKWISEPYVGSMVEWDETAYAGMSVYESLVFEGDRFDPEKRVVQPAADDNWFNIACGAHTLAKLRLTRNTIHTTGWANVQAALKMLSADYCGSGKAFTFPGEPLVWRDRAAMDYLRLNPYKNELEARWDENGATCVSSPRLERSGNPDAAKLYPDIWQAIEEECKLAGVALTKCANYDHYQWETANELVTSANYD
jgi:hypothetical protein